MNHRIHHLLVAAALGCCTVAAIAQDRYREHEFGRGEPPMRFDQRYHHDHYYPARGYAFGVLPQGSIRIGSRDGDWFYHGGVWFRPDGGRFIVALPPIGIVVPLLPPDYATVTLGGRPYFYANGTYYAGAPGQGYVVVEPPPGAEAGDPPDGAYGPPPPAPSSGPSASTRRSEPIVYPRNDQSPGQVDADKTACFRWATQNSVGADADVYQRSFAACMDGRGYSVR